MFLFSQVIFKKAAYSVLCDPLCKAGGAEDEEEDDEDAQQGGQEYGGREYVVHFSIFYHIFLAKLNLNLCLNNSHRQTKLLF